MVAVDASAVQFCCVCDNHTAGTMLVSAGMAVHCKEAIVHVRGV